MNEALGGMTVLPGGWALCEVAVMLEFVRAKTGERR